MQPSPCTDAARSDTAESAPAAILLDPAQLLGGLPGALVAIASGEKLPPPPVGGATIHPEASAGN